MSTNYLSSSVLAVNDRLVSVYFDLNDSNFPSVAGNAVQANDGTIYSGMMGDQISIKDSLGNTVSFDWSSITSKDPTGATWNAALYYTSNGIEIKVDGTQRWTRLEDSSGNWIAFGTAGNLFNTWIVTKVNGDSGGAQWGSNFQTQGLTDGTVISMTPPYVDISDITISSSSVLENQSSGTSIGAFTTYDGSSPFTYSLVAGTGDTDNASFTIVGDTLKTAASFNYEAKSSYSVRVRSEDGSSFFDKQFTITVSNVAEAPTDISITASSVAENEPSGTVVGTLSGVGGVSPFTFSLVAGTGDTDNASFTIDGDSLKTAASFDYETKNSYSIRVQAASGGEVFAKQMTITVTDVAEGVSLPTTGEGAPVVTGGVAIGEVTVDPTVTEVTLNGNPLPTGSVLRNTTTGQKFLKVDGGTTAFLAIPITPDTDWGWSSVGVDAWEVLQNA